MSKPDCFREKLRVVKTKTCPGQAKASARKRENRKIKQSLFVQEALRKGIL